MPRARGRRRCRLAPPRAAADGVGRCCDERELLRVRLAWGDGDVGRRRGRAARALRRRPARRGRARRSTPTRRCCATPRPTRGPASCSPPARPSAPLPQALAAIDLALWDRAGRRDGPAGRAPARRGRRARRCRSTRRSAPRTARARRRRRPRPRPRGLRLREGQGRASATTPAGSPRCAPRSGRTWRSASTPTAPGPRREEALANLRALAPSGIEYAEEPVHGVAALRGGARRSRRCRWRWTRRRPSRAPPGSGAADAVCLKIARCGGISGLLRDAAAARAAGSDGLRRLVVRRAARRSPRALHAAAALAATRPLPACGLATLGDVRGPRGRAGAAGRRDRGAGRARAALTRRRAGSTSSSATAPGASRCTAWPAAATTCTRASREPLRHPLARSPRNFSSRSPTTSSTGIVSSPSRSQSGGITPVPSPRSAAASPAAVLRRRSASASSAIPRGIPANSGCARPLARERLDADRLDPVGERGVGGAALLRARPRRRAPGSRRRARAAARARRSRARRAARSGRPSSSRRA